MVQVPKSLVVDRTKIDRKPPFNGESSHSLEIK